MGQVSFTVPQTGQWTVTGSLGGQTITQTVNVTDKNAVYPIEFPFNSASITVISPVGTSLLLQNGTNQLTKLSTGTDVFIVTNMGTWTISGTLEGYTLNSTSVTAQNGGEYQTQLSIQIAALTVSAPSGTIVTVSGNGQQNEQTVTGTSVMFNLTALDTYTVSGTNGSFVTSTETVDIASFQPYSVTLTLSIATITVTTVAGTLVQAQNGATTLSGTATNGTITFETQTVGTWNISGTLSGYTFPQQSVDVQAYQDYPISLQPNMATLTVSAPDGTYITAQSGNTVYYGISSGTSAEILIYVLGEYTISGENNGLVSDTQTVDVTEFTSYSTTLTIWSATITVTTPTGTMVTAVNGNVEISETSYNNTAVFAVQQTGTWMLSASFDTQTATTTVNVTGQNNYTAALRVPTIVVTTVSSSVVTCTQSPTILTKTAQSNKVYFYPPTTGEWVLNATLNQQSSNTVTVDVQQNQDYPLMLDYEFATITVTTVEDTEITAQNDAITIVQIATKGIAVFEVATMGEWTISATINGELLSEIVNVSDTINYDVSLVPSTIVLDNLSQARDYISAANIGNHIILAGGRIGDFWGTSTDTDIVDVYDTSFTHSMATPLSLDRHGAASATINQSAIFLSGSGGKLASKKTKNVDVYDSALTHSTLPDIDFERSENEIAGTQTSLYALFYSFVNSLYVYDSSFIRSTIAGPQAYLRGLCASYNNETAFFAGGDSLEVDIRYTPIVNTFDNSLTQIQADNLSDAKCYFAGSPCGEYVIFAGGTGENNVFYNSVDAYSSSLTHLTPLSLSAPRAYLSSAPVSNGCVFAGGKTSSIDYSAVVDFYDSMLTRQTPPPLLSAPKCFMGATYMGKNAFFAGGSSSSGSQLTFYDSIEIY